METAKDLHRQEYIEDNDTIVACIQDRSDQPGHTILGALLSLLMKPCKKGNHDEDVDVSCHLYHSDFNKEQIRVHLQLLGVDFEVVTADGAMKNLSRERVLSVTQRRAATANVASGCTSPVHFRHSCNESYIGEIVHCATTSQKLLAHHEAARTSELL